ncbi:MAG: hypothetical protein HPY69_02795 [Armatimonadetes bacterium]|nr:hypothetical protein [Armatimonadota bacterium]
MPLPQLACLALALLTVTPLLAFDAEAAGCERATAYVASTKLVRSRGRTYVTYLDVGFRVQVMALDHATGRWDGPVAVGQADDNHGGAALAVTPDGVLHLCFGPHGTPTRYVHSLAPGDIHRWSEPERVGVRTTYPSLVAAPDGALYLVYRGHDQPEATEWLQWQLTFHVRPPGGPWGRGVVLADMPSETDQPRANYHHRLLLDAHGRLHVAWASILVAPGRVHYLCSDNGGRTWRASPGGSPVTIPATNAAPPAVYVSREANLMVSLAVDREGVPHLLYGPEYGSGSVSHAVPRGVRGWWETDGFRLPDSTVWLHQAAFDTHGNLHVMLFSEQPGQWLGNTAILREAVWAPGGTWQLRTVADLTRYRRGCFMPALATGDHLECLFYSGRDLDRATTEAGVTGHVATDVYYADLTDNWMQRIAPRPGPRVAISTQWQTPLQTLSPMPAEDIVSPPPGGR